MAPRANWKGYLRLSLVSCPVALYPASSLSEKVSFNRINRKTGNRLKQQNVNSASIRLTTRGGGAPRTGAIFSPSFFSPAPVTAPISGCVPGHYRRWRCVGGSAWRHDNNGRSCRGRCPITCVAVSGSRVIVEWSRSCVSVARVAVTIRCVAVTGVHPLGRCGTR